MMTSVPCPWILSFEEFDLGGGILGLKDEEGNPGGVREFEPVPVKTPHWQVEPFFKGEWKLCSLHHWWPTVLWLNCASYFVLLLLNLGYVPWSFIFKDSKLRWLEPICANRRVDQKGYWHTWVIECLHVLMACRTPVVQQDTHTHPKRKCGTDYTSLKDSHRKFRRNFYN